METTNFGIKVSKRLDFIGRNQAELAAAIGASEQYVSDTIRLNRIPGGRRIVEIARYLGVPAEYLLDDGMAVGDYPGLSSLEEAVLEAARIVGLEEARRRIMNAKEGEEKPSHRPKTDRDWGGDVLPVPRVRDQGKPKSG